MTKQVRPKRKLGKTLTQLQIRLTHQEKNRIKALASIYAGGNMSLWMIYGALSAPRVFLKGGKEKI